MRQPLGSPHSSAQRITHVSKLTPMILIAPDWDEPRDYHILRQVYASVAHSLQTASVGRCAVGGSLSGAYSAHA